MEKSSKAYGVLTELKDRSGTVETLIYSAKRFKHTWVFGQILS